MACVDAHTSGKCITPKSSISAAAVEETTLQTVVVAVGGRKEGLIEVHSRWRASRTDVVSYVDELLSENICPDVGGSKDRTGTPPTS
jgi:hypothetical protein